MSEVKGQSVSSQRWRHRIESTDNMIQTPSLTQIYSRVRIVLLCIWCCSRTMISNTNCHGPQQELCDITSNTVREDYRIQWIFSVSAPFSHCDDAEVTEMFGDRGARTWRRRFCSWISLEHRDASEQRILELFKLWQQLTSANKTRHPTTATSSWWRSDQ